MEPLPELEWWVENREKVKARLGLKHLALVQGPDNFYYEWYREGDPYVYGSESLEILEREANEPIPAFEESKPVNRVQSVLTLKAERRIMPNEKCPCGTGKKYKKCCGR